MFSFDILEEGKGNWIRIALIARRVHFYKTS